MRPVFAETEVRSDFDFLVCLRVVRSWGSGVGERGG